MPEYSPETFDPEFYCPFTVHEDGSITDSSVYVPSLLDDEIDSDGWEFASAGYTYQDSYNGPIMHDSEFFGGRLRDDTLSTPGTYVLLPSEYADNEEYPYEGETYADGWAILRFVGE
jgi:hypothetical protein